MTGTGGRYTANRVKPGPKSGIQVGGLLQVTCREFADFMMDYLSDELPSDSRRAFDYHLSLCNNCQRYLAGYQESVKLGKRAFEDDDAPLPTTVPEELVKAILTARLRR